MSASSSPPIFLVSERFGDSGGGEAIKAYQYAHFLRAKGYEVIIFTHERSVQSLGAKDYTGEMRLVPETWLQYFLWRSRIFKSLLQPYFHLKTRSNLLRELKSKPSAIVHYISPVSPVVPRFAPMIQRIVFGPMTGNIYYPPAFRHRASRGFRIRAGFHDISQLILGKFFPEKQRSACLLVSGGARTRQSLHRAGCTDVQMVDVIDSGVSESLKSKPRLEHKGENPRFICSGRMVDYKGMDLAIKAVAKSAKPLMLDIYGDGDARPNLEALVADLGVSDRVTFKGWVTNPEFLEAARSGYRGFIFPTLAEANGIVMQEAMMMGLPVVTLRWGGPSSLADDTSAILIAPESEEKVVVALAEAMDKLAYDPDLANTFAQNAREAAETNFTWDAVTASWLVAYDRALATRPV